MSIDLIIHAGTKFALHQWLDARGLGVNVQNTDPNSPDFGEYTYTHTAPGAFLYWNHPSGVVTKSIDNTDPENPVPTNFAGFYALLKFPDSIPADLQTWVSSFTAVSILDGIEGVGGEGITIVNPEDLRSAVVAGGGSLWDGILGVGNQWSDPRLWAFQNVMTGDQRDFDGVTYESLIDFNVWSPTQFPGGWVEVGPATNEWAAGVTYAVDDEVTYEGATYVCIQGHTSQAGWEPPAVPALWSAT